MVTVGIDLDARALASLSMALASILIPLRLPAGDVEVPRTDRGKEFWERKEFLGEPPPETTEAGSIL